MDLNKRLLIFHRSLTKDSVNVSVNACVVGADGNYSVVRRICEDKALLSVESTDWGLKMRYLVVPNPESLPPSIDGRVHYVMGSGSYVCQQPDGAWNVSYAILPDSDQFLSSAEATPENIDKLRKHATSTSRDIAQHLLTSDDFFKQWFSCRAFSGMIVKCSSLAPKEWIALIGDAGHAVAPFTGEGINSGLESASMLADILIDGKSCQDYSDSRLEDAHALNRMALRTKAFIRGSDQEKCAHLFATIVLGILKKMGCVKGVINDYMLGEKSSKGVWRYRDLAALDDKQRGCLSAFATCCFHFCCCSGRKSKKN
jgi:2-polyprenyl-6-methoxyphenol hydroxylase-like FAD-dependent oxidoreductase